MADLLHTRVVRRTDRASVIGDAHGVSEPIDPTDPADPADQRLPQPSPRSRARLLALTRRDHENAAGLVPAPMSRLPPDDTEEAPLRMRVIALENLVIALLADASDLQRAIAADMGDFISPRPGFTPHPLTLRAAEAMRSLLDGANRFRTDGAA